MHHSLGLGSKSIFTEVHGLAINHGPRVTLEMQFEQVQNRDSASQPAKLRGGVEEQEARNATLHCKSKVHTA